MTNDTLNSRIPDPFLHRAGWGTAEKKFLAGDCSYRRYYRLEKPEARAVLMDAPPPFERVDHFMHVTEILSRKGLSVPRIFSHDEAQGFLLLEDLGDLTYSQALKEGYPEEQLYHCAVDVLISLCTQEAPLPAYDKHHFHRELDVFTQWYGQLCHLELPSMEDVMEPLRLELTPLPPSLVLRDFHIDNLMWLENRTGHQMCGLLDYQDALLGSPAYDLVSLLEDARRDISPALEKSCYDRFLKGAPSLDPTAFFRHYRVWGLQRSLKILGVFARQALHYNNPRYLVHLPRVWRYIDRACKEDFLRPVHQWLSIFMPPEKRRVSL